MLITTRRYAGETYYFYNEGNCIVCKTPENAFGYPDIVLLDMHAWTNTGTHVFERVYAPRAYTLHRYLAPWILKRIERVMIKLTEGITTCSQ